MTYQTATIYHNVQRDDHGHAPGFSGYRPGHAMAPVFAYADDHPQPPEHAFHVFNAPEDFLVDHDLPLARRYRANRLRSLSVGDVVQVGDAYHAVASFGFDPVGEALNVQPDPDEAARWKDEEQA